MKGMKLLGSNLTRVNLTNSERELAFVMKSYHKCKGGLDGKSHTAAMLHLFDTLADLGADAIPGEQGGGDRLGCCTEAP